MPPSPVTPVPIPKEFGWLRIELTHVEVSGADFSGLREHDIILLDELWTRVDAGESGFASLFVSTGHHFRVRLALAANGYVATVAEERAFARPKRDSIAVRLCVDLVQRTFDAREPPEVGVGDELLLYLAPTNELLLSVDDVPVGRGLVWTLEGHLGIQIGSPA